MNRNVASSRTLCQAPFSVISALPAEAQLGTSSMTEKVMPRAFSFRNRRYHSPWVANVVVIALAMAYTLTNTLEAIAVFSSMTFLLVSIGVCLANLRLRERTRSRVTPVVLGIALMLATVGLLVGHLVRTDATTLTSVGILYASVFAAELCFSERRVIFRRTR